MHLKENYIHKERFFTLHQVYDKDHQLHQILFKALEIVEQFTKGTFLSSQCKQVKIDFPEVSEINITKKMLDEVKFNRKNKEYVKAFEIARLILLNYNPNITNGREKMIALLFDMNKLWEEFITIKLREELKDESVSVGKEIMPFWGSNRLEPDIVINGDGICLIIDTKWKNREF